MYSYIQSVRHIRDYTLEIVFQSGEKGTVDLAEYVNKGGVFARFAEMDYFKQVTVDDIFGVLTWPGGVDIAPETIYDMATGKSQPEKVN